jgi:RND superfamily putative drug exporter
VRRGLEGVTVGFAGQTALAAETVQEAQDNVIRLAVAALVVNFLFLVVFLRAVIAPLYLLAASVLALAATLGLTAFVFQDLLGYGQLAYYIPFAASVLLLSLGSDYNIFIVGRIWDEMRKRDVEAAVEKAAPEAAGPITLAGLVLAGSFGLLALIPLTPFREFAFVMAVGVLIDSFVVRSLLAPSLISLLSRRSARGRPLDAVGTAGSGD